MHMILHTADTLTFATRVSGYGRKIGMNGILYLRAEIGASSFRAKDQVNNDDTQ